MNQDRKASSLQGLFPILLVLGFWSLVFAVSLNTYCPVEPRSSSAPEDQFSAARAEGILKILVGDSIPHPAGSEQNKIVRERIVELLTSYGYVVEIQDGASKVHESLRKRFYGNDQVELNNIIAIRRADPGNVDNARQQAIMLVAHYDSVAMGPGASDDGVGTATVLEIARMMAGEPDPKRDVVFLITDGEELGLLGARMFVDTHPLANRIGAVVNLEARGTGGPSIMFETSLKSRSLISIFDQASSKPFCSSLFFEIYKRLPNDTDFTVFKGDGILGYNLAFIGDVRNYHTEMDNLENVDLGCLQHHGENALGLIRGLLDSDAFDQVYQQQETGNAKVNLVPDEAVYFDFLGLAIVAWPSSWSIWICLVAALFFVVACFRLPSRAAFDSLPGDRHRSWQDAVFQVGFQVLLIVAVFVSGFLIQAMLRWDPRLSHGWPLHPFPIMLGFWSASFAIVGGLAGLFARSFHPRSTWIGFSAIWLGIAIGVSVYVNGASYLFIIPIVTTSLVAAFANGYGRRGMVLTVVVAAFSIGLIWIPMERLFYDAVGFQMPVATFFRISMVATILPGLLSLAHPRLRFSFTLLMAVLSVVAMVTAVVVNSPS